MGQPASERRLWCVVLVAVVAGGLLSRAVHTGYLLFDKYLGDALYAAMVYSLLRLSGRVAHAALWAAVLMTAIECFQLTGIAAHLYRSPHTALRLCARLLGTDFSFYDLQAYAVGIMIPALLDRVRLDAMRKQARPGH